MDFNMYLMLISGWNLFRIYWKKNWCLYFQKIKAIFKQLYMSLRRIPSQHGKVSVMCTENDQSEIFQFHKVKINKSRYQTMGITWNSGIYYVFTMDMGE